MPKSKQRPAKIAGQVANTAEVQRLLREAAKALSEDRLTTPVDDNAWYRYLRVLVLDAGNQAAQHGISDIVEKYLAWAIEDIEAGYLRKARNYLGKVRAIDDAHPNLAAVEKRLADKQGASQQTIKLSTRDLDNRADSLARELLELGNQIQQLNSRVLIIVRNDAEGRWIYQQLNKAEKGPRIRARIQLDLVPSIRIYTPQ